MGPQPADVTQLLKAWSEGDRSALEELTPKVYVELRRAANKYMRSENSGNTFQPTALVHEVFLRLVEVTGVSWRNRAHVFAISAKMMRRILVDRARAKGMGKRGGKALRLNLDDAPQIAATEKGRELLAIDEALNALTQFDERKTRVVELRFFGVLSVEGTAEVLAISPQSVMRDWKIARAWLLTELAH